MSRSKLVDGKLVAFSAQDETDRDAEEAAWAAGAAARAAANDSSDIANLPKQIKAALLAAAALSGKTAADAKAAFNTAWKSLP